MLRRLPVALLCVACAALPARATAPTPDQPLLVTGSESAASTDGALAIRFNPAGLGVRYPSELDLGWSRLGGKREVNDGVLTLRGLGLQFQRIRDTSQTYGFGFAAGHERLRAGATAIWLLDARTHEVVADHRLGLLSRPRPWLSLGAVMDHVFQPLFRGDRLGRQYTLAVGLRPLAFARGRAYEAGTRFTLIGDVIIADDGEWRQSRVRIGAELEPVSGLVVEGSLEDHGGVHVGIGLRGPRSSVHVQTASVNGDHAYDSYALSLHDGEEPTFLARAARGRVAVVRAGGELGDESLSGLSLFGATSYVSARPVHDQLERSLHDPLTRGVLLDLHGISNMAQIEELRPRIESLRHAGKPVVAFLEEQPTRGDLYLAGPCDRIVTTEEAEFGGLGLRVERRYYRKLLEDWGVRIDRTSYGKYKSAYRNYSVDSTPAPDRESIEHSLDVSQKLFVSALVSDRHLERDRLLTLLDGRPWRAEDVRRFGLIDSIGYREDALAIVGHLSGLGPRPATVDLARVARAHRAWMVPTGVAIVYASGGIQSGASGNDLLFGPSMGSDTVVRQLERAFNRRDVKAVVLRVESPGGETIASDLIHHATVRLKRETGKPLIVSMGESAASGGYYIAAHADRIFADRYTYTGSIGVLEVKPSLEGFDRRHDVHEDDFERGRYMAGWSLHRDWTTEMQAIADSATYAYYRAFVAKVAEGRHLAWSDVDAVAQGRVWMGDDARTHRLVDEIGGLDAALAEARRRAGIPPGERIRPVEFRRPRPGLLQRLAGSALRETLEQSLRMPAPGAILYWNDDPEAP
jgi:protease-4